MEISTLMEFALADESFKVVGLVILWQMRTEMKMIKDAVKDLTVKMADHEKQQDARWNNHEKRLSQLEKGCPVQMNHENRLYNLEHK